MPKIGYALSNYLANIKTGGEEPADLSNCVLKELPEGEYIQKIEGSLQSKDGDTWHIGPNSSDTTNYFAIEEDDANTGKPMRMRGQINHTSTTNGVDFYARYGEKDAADMVEVAFNANYQKANFSLTNNTKGTKIEVSDDLKATMVKNGETRTIDLWEVNKQSDVIYNPTTTIGTVSSLSTQRFTDINLPVRNGYLTCATSVQAVYQGESIPISWYQEGNYLFIRSFSNTNSTQIYGNYLFIKDQ